MNQLSLDDWRNDMDICARKSRNSATSRAANPTDARKREVYSLILDLLRLNPAGLTSKEIARLLEMELHQVSGRLSELRHKHKEIFGIGTRRDGAEVLMRSR